MKSRILLTVVMLFSIVRLMAQENNKSEVSLPRIPLIGESAPSFIAQSTNGEINFPEVYGRSWKILFSHPADFTPVCSTELLELAQLQDDFSNLGVKLAVVSTDALSNHEAWKKSIETIKYKGRNPAKIEFPLIDDQSWQVAKEYGMIQPSANPRKDVRGVFIIDPSNIIQAVFFYPMNVGRNMDEIKRTVTALQIAQKNKVLTPADWKPGDDVLIKNVRNADEKEALAAQTDPNLYEVSWYMIFQKMK